VKAILIFLSPAGVHVSTLTPAGDVHIHGEQKKSLALATPSHRLQVERGLLKVLIVAELWDTISGLLLVPTVGFQCLHPSLTLKVQEV
jgi:hypothetical protein